MQKSKLIKLLKILDSEEFKQFPKFIKSPFFNSNKHYLTLYNCIKKYHPDFNSPKLNRELVYKKIFPEKTFHYNVYNNLTSGFTRLTEEYLSHLQFQKERLENQKMLLKAYEQRKGAFDFFEKQISNLQEELEMSPYKNVHYYKEKFWLDQRWFNHPEVDKQLFIADKYNDSLNTLDTLFILEKLLLVSELKGREVFLSEKYEVWVLDAIKKRQHNNPLYLVYLDIINLLETDEDDDYLKLKSTFENNLEQFNQKEQQNILQVLINHAIRKGNSGNAAYIKENLELYKIGLRQNLFLDNGQMNDTVYTNIIGVAVKAGVFEWCFEFLNAYDFYLNEKIRKDAKSLALGIWYYYQGHFKEAINYLNDFDFVNDLYQIRGRALLMKIYFKQFLKDKSYYDLLIMQCKSFEKYIRRNSLIASRREQAYLDFILLLRQLSKGIMDFKITSTLKSNWLERIESKSYVYGKDWLKEQIGML